mgnify:CR=1 FL=1
MQQVAWLLATYSACTSALRPAAYTPARATTRLAATTPSLGLYGDWEPSAGGSYVHPPAFPVQKLLPLGLGSDEK